MIKLIENNLEPNGINFGMQLHIGFNIFDFHPFPVFHLFGIDDWTSVEIADHHVIEFAASLPERFKLRRLTTKYLLKRALKKVLPAEILERRKMGFGVPIGHWFRGEMQSFLRESLLSE